MATSAASNVLPPVHTLLHSFPRHTAWSIAASVVQLLDTSEEAANGAGSSAGVVAEKEWTKDHVTWCMEGIGYALTLSIHHGAHHMGGQTGQSTPQHVGFESESSAAAAFQLVSGATRIYTRWLLSAALSAPGRGRLGPSERQIMIRQLAAVFETSTLLVGWTSPISPQPVQERRIVHSHMMGADPVLMGSQGHQQQASAANTAAQASHHHSHHHAHQVALDQRFMTLACRVLHTFHRLGRSMSTTSASDQGTWSTLLECTLRIFAILLSKDSSLHSPALCAALEPLVVRVTFDLVLRSQSGFSPTAPGQPAAQPKNMWKTFSHTLKSSILNRWPMRCWKVAAGTITQRMWRIMEHSSIGGGIAPSTSTTGDRLTFKWPLYEPPVNADSVCVNTVSAAYATVGTTTTVYFSAAHKLLYCWYQLLHCYGQQSVLETLVTPSVQATSAQPSWSAPAAHHTTHAAPPSNAASSRTQKAGTVSSASGNATAAGNTLSPNDREAHAHATSQQHDVFHIADRFARGQVYKLYTEGMVQMVDAFLRRPMKKMERIPVVGNEQQPQSSQSLPQSQVSILPQNIPFLLRTFGPLLFEIAETIVPGAPTSGGAGSTGSSSAAPHSNSGTANQPGSLGLGGEHDGFELSRALAIGCLLRLFTTKIWNKTDGIALPEITRLYALIKNALNSPSNHVVPTAIFLHSGSLFTSALPSAQMLVQYFWSHLRYFLTQTGDPSSVGYIGGGSRGSSQGSSNSSSTSAASVVGRRRFKMLTRVRRTCIRILSVATVRTAEAHNDAMRLAKLQQQGDASVPSQQAPSGLAVAIKSIAGAASIAASTPNAASAAATTSTGRAGVSSFNAFLILHAAQIDASVSFYHSLYTSFPHIALNALFSEQEEVNLCHILEQIVRWVAEEQEKLPVVATAHGADGFLHGQRAPTGSAASFHGSSSSHSSTQQHSSSSSSSLSTFPHMALTTLWKLLVEEIWTCTVQYRALKILEQMSVYAMVIQLSNSFSIGNWIQALCKFIERKVTELEGPSASASTSHPLQSPSNPRAPNSPPPLTKMNAEERRNHRRILTAAYTCLRAWLVSCPSILASSAPAAVASSSHSPLPSHHHSSGNAIGGAKSPSSPLSPPPVPSLPRGSPELTKAILDCVLRGVKYGASTAHNANEDGDTFSPHEIKRQKHEVYVACMRLLQSILFDAGTWTVQHAAQLRMGYSMLNHPGASFPSKDSFRAPSTPIGAIFNGILTRSALAEAMLLQSGNGQGRLLNESILLQHLALEGFVSNISENQTRWIILHQTTLVSFTPFSTLPIHKSGAGASLSKQAASSDSHLSHAEPNSTLVVLRDGLGRQAFICSSILLPASHSSLKDDPPGYHPPPAQPVWAEEGEQDQFWSALGYLGLTNPIVPVATVNATATSSLVNRTDDTESTELPRSSTHGSGFLSIQSGGLSGSSLSSSTHASPHGLPLSIASASFSSHTSQGASSSQTATTAVFHTQEWLAAQGQSEAHKMYARLIAQQAATVQNATANTNSNVLPESKQREMDEKSSSSSASFPPPTDQSLVSLRTCLSNLGVLSSLAPAPSNSPSSTPITLLQSSSVLREIVAQLDFGSSGVGVDRSASSSTRRVGILYRALGQHREADLYANRTSGVEGLSDHEFDCFLDCMVDSSSTTGSHEDQLEFLVASRMYGGFEHDAAQMDRIRSFLKRQCSVVLIWSREPSEFVPTPDMGEDDSHASTADKPRMYVVVWPQYELADTDGPVVDPKASSFRVRIVTTGFLPGQTSMDEPEQPHEHHVTEFIAAPHPKEKRSDKGSGSGNKFWKKNSTKNTPRLEVPMQTESSLDALLPEDVLRGDPTPELSLFPGPLTSGASGVSTHAPIMCTFIINAALGFIDQCRTAQRDQNTLAPGRIIIDSDYDMRRSLISQILAKCSYQQNKSLSLQSLFQSDGPFPSNASMVHA